MNQTESNNRTMRLAITTYILNMGGVSNFILELGKFLYARGYEVSIICTDRKGDWYERIGQEGLKGSYFNSGFWEWIPFGRILHAWRIGRYMRKQAFDCIINNHSFYVHASAGYFFDQSRIIHVVHNQLKLNVEREADSMSDKVVGVSPRIEELARQLLPAQMVTSILNGIRLPVIAQQDYKECCSRPEDILFVGRIDNNSKAIFLIPDIMKYLIDRGVKTKITIVGNGPDFAALKQMVEDKSLSEYFQLRGKVEPEEVSNYYYTHKILLLPSYFEGRPLTLMEAMAHGCVPVASFLPQCTDICIEQDRSGYLVEVGNVAGFAQRIIELLSNEKRLNDFGKGAVDRAREHFSSDETHQKYLELIQSYEEMEKQRGSYPLFNRKYLSWKEIVPFRLVLFIKRKILKSL